MKVEVTAENIIRYRLVDLTGNDSDSMLHAARLAEIDGDVLHCEVPDAWIEHLKQIRSEEKQAEFDHNRIRNANTFEMFGDGTPADMAKHNDVIPLQQGIDAHFSELADGRRIMDNLRFYEIVVGGVPDPTSTSHIPFPPDMVPYEDEEE